MLISEFLNSIVYHVTNLAALTKAKVLTGVVLSMVWFVFPDADHRSALQLLIVLTVIDTVTALIAAAKTGRPIRSGFGFLSTATKLSVYFLLSAAFSIAGQIIGIDIMFVILSYLAGNELLSVAENAGEAGMPLPDSIMQAVRGKLKLS